MNGVVFTGQMISATRFLTGDNSKHALCCHVCWLFCTATREGDITKASGLGVHVTIVEVQCKTSLPGETAEQLLLL